MLMVKCKSSTNFLFEAFLYHEKYFSEVISLDLRSRHPSIPQVLLAANPLAKPLGSPNPPVHSEVSGDFSEVGSGWLPKPLALAP